MSILATSLAALLGIGTSPIAAATAPVTVVSCDYTAQALPASTTGIEGPAANASAGNLRISFVNQAPLTATGVRFAVRYAGRTAEIDDAGTFSTGATIVHEFAPAGDAYGASDAQCTVESVTFSDGSTWQPA